VDDVIDHHLSQGFEHLIIVDHGSTDGTQDSLRKAARSKAVTVLDGAGLPFWQAELETELARLCRRNGAAWVVPFDADEFWLATGGTVTDWLSAADVDIVVASVHNLFPDAEDPGRLRVDSQPHPQRKVCARPRRSTTFSAGHHDVFATGRRGQGLVVAHVPWRSFAQLQRKVHQGAKAAIDAGHRSGLSGHWIHLASLTEDELFEVWSSISSGTPTDGVGWSPIGELVEAVPRPWHSWPITKPT
jgi:hypothetical protein